MDESSETDSETSDEESDSESSDDEVLMASALLVLQKALVVRNRRRRRGLFHYTSPFALPFITDMERHGIKRKLNGALEEQESSKRNQLATLDGRSGQKPGETLKKMLQIDNDLSHRQKRVFLNRRDLKSNRRAIADLKEQIENLQSIGDSLVTEVGEDERAIKEKQTLLDQLRYWSKPVVLQALPDEVLKVIFAYLGYDHQQRLVRVSKRWKLIITVQLSDVYMDTKTLLDAKRDKGGSAVKYTTGEPHKKIAADLRKSPRANYFIPAWKYRCTAVRRVIFDGRQITVLIRETCDLIEAWVERLPNLHTVVFAQVILENALIPLTKWRSDHPGIRVVIADSLVRPLWPGLPPLCKSIVACRFHSYMRLPEMVLTTAEVFEKVVTHTIWPYPDEQLQWLARNACRMNSDTVQVMLSYEQSREHEYSSRKFSTTKNSCCPEHRLFCRHLEPSFYMNKLDAQMRNFLAVFLILRVPGSPPPFPLQYERFQIIKKQRVLLPKF